MKKHHARIPALVSTLLATGILCMWGLVALAQENMTHISSDAFPEHSRPAAVFKHDSHNEKAGIDDCAACHHGKTADGKQDPTDMTAGTNCSECHAVNAKEGTPLRRAFHQQCMDCHREKNIGPTTCGSCHVKS